VSRDRDTSPLLSLNDDWYVIKISDRRGGYFRRRLCRNSSAGLGSAQERQCDEHRMQSARRVVVYRVAQSLMRLGSLMRLAALIASQAALAQSHESAKVT